MSPLFMDAGYELNSPGSGSGELSNTPGSEREGEGGQIANRGKRRLEKNRDAARKSRKKQTERADELHEELQCLERSNSALKKEIATLKKEFQLYMTALERHKSICCLKDSTTHLVNSADHQSKSSPPGVPHQASSSTFAAAPSLSTSLTCSTGLQTCDFTESTHPEASPTTLASPSGSPTEPFSTSVAAPVSFPAALAPHSLFSEDPPPLITSNVPPVCTGLDSNPSSSLAAAAQPRPGQGNILESSSASTNARYSPLDEFLMTQAPFITASPNNLFLYSQVEAEVTGLVTPSCLMNEPQLHPGLFSKISTNSSPPSSLLPPTLPDPALQDPPVPSPAPAFELSYSQHVPLDRVSLLSMLTVPSPPNMCQTTSSSFDGPAPQPPPMLPLLGDTSRDLSLSELLEGNDWILSGTSHQ